MTHLERNRKYREGGGGDLKLAHRWQMRCHRTNKRLLKAKNAIAEVKVQLGLIKDARTGCHCTILSDRPCERCWERIRGPLGRLNKILT